MFKILFSKKLQATRVRLLCKHPQILLKLSIDTLDPMRGLKLNIEIR